MDYNDGECSSLVVSFSSNEWREATKHLNQSKRKKFRIGFTNMLTKKLQKEGVNCHLRCKHNWLNLKGWSGKYECVLCSKEFEASIPSLKAILFDKPVDVNVNWKGKIVHKKITRKEQLRGETRQNVAMELLAKGVACYRSELIIKNKKEGKDFGEVTDANVLRTAKYQFAHENKIFTELFADCEASKLLYERLCKARTFFGYVQEINQNPFGLLLISEIQINMWAKIQEEHPIWFLDATGSLTPDIDGQSSVYLYSLVCYSPSTRVLISVADFLSTRHTSLCIMRYLLAIKHMISDNMKSIKLIKIPPVIVTDHSWALINAVIKTFSNCSILEYLHYAYCYLVTQNENKFAAQKVLKTKLYICSTHMLKIIIKKAKELNINSNVRHVFIFAFTLLQNSTTITKFDRNLIHIYNLFMQPRKNLSYLLSYCTIKNELCERKVYKSANLHAEENVEEELENALKYICLSENELKNIKNNSPFTAYYGKIICKLRDCIQNGKSYNLESDPINEHYSPALIEIILNRLYHVPMWSGLLLDQNNMFTERDTSSTRLSNNKIEDYFKIIKHNYLKKKRVMPSELTSYLYTRLLSIYIEYFEVEDTYELENNNLSNAIEKWSDKKMKRPKHKKGFYYERTENFGEKLKTTTEFDNEIEFRDAFNSELNESLPNLNQEQNIECILQFNKLDLPNYEHNINDNNELFKSQNIDDLSDTQICNIFNNCQDKPFVVLSNILLAKRDFLIQMVKCVRKFQIRCHSTEKVCVEARTYLEWDAMLYTWFFPLIVKNDGNCLYHSVSWLLFGTDNQCKLLKLLTGFIIFDNQSYFKKVMQLSETDISYENLLERAVQWKEWGCEFHTLALAILLERPIYIYTNSTIHHDYTIRNCGEKAPLAILHVINHFMALMPVNLEISPPRPDWRQFRDFAENIKQYE